jgi:chromosome segregation ATPase
VEYADKNEEYEDLRDKFKNLSHSYDKLYKIYEESKSNDLKQYENIDNKELMIQQLNQKIQDLKIENDRYKSKYNESSKELEAMKMVLKFKYVLKAESEKNIDYLKFRIQKYENDNSTLKNYVKELQKENDNLMKEKEFLEEQINSNLNNMRTNEDKSNYTTLVEETEEKEDNDDKEIKEKKEEKKEEEKSSDKEVSDLEEYQTGNLGELLNDCEELESEEEQKPEDNKDSNTTNENTNIEQKNENHQDDNINENIKINDTLITVNEDKDKDKDKEKDVKKTVTFSINTEEKKKLAKKKIKDSIRLRHCGSVKIRVKKGISGGVNSAYNVMFQGKQFQFPSRVVNKKNVDYFKQFFFLLIQAMKINSDKVQLFLGLDPESLYNQCKSEHVPFHKYQKWLEHQLMKKEEINDERKHEDFATLTGIFCSSLI